jgi:Zn-dependent oligopeptidase
VHGTRALKSSTAETPDMVNEFLEILTQQLQKRAAADFNTMKKMKAAENPGFVGQVWIILLHFSTS